MKYYALSQSLKNISRWWPDEWNVSTTVALAAAVLAIFAIAFLASRTGAAGSTQKRKQQRNSVPITAEFAPNAGATPASTPASTPAPMQAPTPTPVIARTAAVASTVSPPAPAPSSKKEESPPPREPEPVVRQAAQPTASVSSPKQSVAAVSLSPETKTAASPARVETTATPAKAAAASSPSKVEPAVLPTPSPQKETAATPAKALSTEATPTKSSTAPATSTMVDFLIKVAQLSHDDVSVALGYSGKNGARDVASFLEGRSKDAEERTAKLAEYYEAQAQQWAVTTVKHLTEQQGVSLAVLSEALGYSGKNGARDVATFVEGRSTDLEARRGRLVEFVTKISPPVKASPQKEVPAAAATASATKASVETSEAQAPSSAAAQIHFLTTVVGCSNSDVSVALGYSGKNGVRDIAAFLEGRSKGAEERTARLAEYYETQAQQWAVATVKHLTEHQGVSLAVLSEALGYSGKNGARDVAAFIEGRSTDLEARRGRLREFVDKQKQYS